LGAAFRLKVFSFFAFKRDHPQNSYVNEQRGLVPDLVTALEQESRLVGRP
jgi:hypothetical protein